MQVNQPTSGDYILVPRNLNVEPMSLWDSFIRMSFCSDRNFILPNGTLYDLVSSPHYPQRLDATSGDADEKKDYSYGNKVVYNTFPLAHRYGKISAKKLSDWQKKEVELVERITLARRWPNSMTPT